MRESENIMLDILGDMLPDGAEIISTKTTSNRRSFDVEIRYSGVTASCEVPKQSIPGAERKTVANAINTVMASIWFQKGDIKKSQQWLSGEYLKEQKQRGVRKKKTDNMRGCDCCNGNEALWFQDDENSVFVDEHGRAKVTVCGKMVSLQVKYCPNCGKRLH